MNDKQTALVEDDIDELNDGDFWLTPPEMLKALQDEFDFDFDAAPYPRPAGFDALKEEWGRSTYVNPPIGKGQSLSRWVKKAVEENKKGKKVVLFLPFPRWFRYLLSVDPEFRFPGVVHFLNSKGRPTKSEGG